METIPFDVFYDMVVNILTVQDFIRLCKTNKLHLSLCQDEALWHTFAMREFPDISKIEHYTWKQHYLTQKKYHEKNLKKFGPTYRPPGVAEISHDFDLSHLKQLSNSQQDLHEKHGTNYDNHPVMWQHLARLKPSDLFNFFLVNRQFTGHLPQTRTLVAGGRSIKQIVPPNPEDLVENWGDFWKYVIQKQNPGLEAKYPQTWRNLFEEINGFSEWKNKHLGKVPNPKRNTSLLGPTVSGFGGYDLVTSHQLGGRITRREFVEEGIRLPDYLRYGSGQ